MKDEIKEKIKAYYVANDIDEIIDCITNLQEEIHKKETMYDSLAVDYRLSQEENERLKELNVCVGCNNNPDYKSRNEKAIEYIKSLCYIESKNEWFTYGDDLSPEHIVNILKGSDEE